MGPTLSSVGRMPLVIKTFMRVASFASEEKVFALCPQYHRISVQCKDKHFVKNIRTKRKSTENKKKEN